jgi:hypothetical protein
MFVVCMFASARDKKSTCWCILDILDNSSRDVGYDIVHSNGVHQGPLGSRSEAHAPRSTKHGFKRSQIDMSVGVQMFRQGFEFN